MKTTYIKPGQLITISNAVYRAKKRTGGCAGCDLNDVFTCPCMPDSRFGARYNCSLHGIILKKT